MGRLFGIKGDQRGQSNLIDQVTLTPLILELVDLVNAPLMTPAFECRIQPYIYNGNS